VLPLPLPLPLQLTLPPPPPPPPLPIAKEPSDAATTAMSDGARAVAATEVAMADASPVVPPAGAMATVVREDWG